MVNASERTRHTKQKYQKKNNLIPLKGILGRADGTINTASGLGTIWVQQYSDQGLLERIALPPTIPFALTPGLPITFKYTLQGKLQVDAIDTAALVSNGIQPTATTQRQISNSTPQANFETLRCVAQATPSLTVSVKAWVVLISGNVYLFSGSTQDLTSYAPAAGNMRYVCLFVKSDYSSALEVNASTERSQADVPLGAADILECTGAASAGSTAVWAIKLVSGQTAVTQSDIDNDGRDLRQLVNTGSVVPGTAISTITTVTAASVAAGVYETILCDCTANAITVNLPVAASSIGKKFNIKKIDSTGNAVIVDGNAAETIDSALTQTFDVPWMCMSLQCNGSGWYII